MQNYNHIKDFIGIPPLLKRSYNCGTYPIDSSYDTHTVWSGQMRHVYDVSECAMWETNDFQSSSPYANNRRLVVDRDYEFFRKGDDLEIKFMIPMYDNIEYVIGHHSSVDVQYSSCLTEDVIKRFIYDDPSFYYGLKYNNMATPQHKIWFEKSMEEKL